MKNFSTKQFLLFTIFSLVAAASYAGFVAKWGFRDGSDRFSLERILDGTAHRPFVYRQLVPIIANEIERITPEKISTKIVNVYNFGPFRYYNKATNLSNKTNAYKYKWIIIYWMGFFFLLVSLYLLKNTLSLFGVSEVASILAPCLFSLFLPIIQTVGGYYYDFSELFFMALVMLLMIKNHYWLAVATVCFATLNKESFVFFIPTLFPLVTFSKNRKRFYLALGFMVIAAIFLNIWIKSIYVNNLGEVVELHLWSNIKSYLNPRTYLQFDDSYGMIAPQGFNFINLFLIFFLVKSGWHRFNLILKFHAWIALAISLPLFIAFCATNELRNLSFLYVTLVFLIAYCIESFQEHSVHEPLKSKNFNI